MLLTQLLFRTQGQLAAPSMLGGDSVKGREKEQTLEKEKVAVIGQSGNTFGLLNSGDSWGVTRNQSKNDAFSAKVHFKVTILCFSRHIQGDVFQKYS